MAKLTFSFKRILLKISGESLLDSQNYGIEWPACQKLAKAIKRFADSGLEIALVIGGGNIFRGIQSSDWEMERTPADQMGMLATLINGLALQQALESVGCKAKVMSALECPKAAEPFNWNRALQLLEEKKVLIFVGGTGNPYFTTDTAAALRASEIHADLLLKATKVDGVFDKDPIKHPDAKKYDQLSYNHYLTENLGVMDATAISLCQSNKLPVFVFNMKDLYEDTTLNEMQGTLIKES